jgi:hypothetical protein
MSETKEEALAFLAAPNGSSRELLSSIRPGSGGPAGVFTIWYHGTLLYAGRSRVAAGEGKASNLSQADGARGRLRGVLRQPPKSLQQRLRLSFPDEMTRAEGVTDRERAAFLLRKSGTFRVVEVASGAAAEALFAHLLEHLDSSP